MALVCANVDCRRSSRISPDRVITFQAAKTKDLTKGINNIASLRAYDRDKKPAPVSHTARQRAARIGLDTGCRAWQNRKAKGVPDEHRANTGPLAGQPLSGRGAAW